MQAPGLTPQCKLVQQEEWMLLKHPVSGRTRPLKHLLSAVPLKNALQSFEHNLIPVQTADQNEEWLFGGSL